MIINVASIANEKVIQLYFHLKTCRTVANSGTGLKTVVSSRMTNPALSNSSNVTMAGSEVHYKSCKNCCQPILTSLLPFFCLIFCLFLCLFFCIELVAIQRSGAIASIYKNTGEGGQHFTVLEQHFLSAEYYIFSDPDCFQPTFLNGYKRTFLNTIQPFFLLLLFPPPKPLARGV